MAAGSRILLSSLHGPILLRKKKFLEVSHRDISKIVL